MSFWRVMLCVQSFVFGIVFVVLGTSQGFAQSTPHACFQLSSGSATDYYYHNTLTSSFDSLSSVYNQGTMSSQCSCVDGYKKVKKKLYTNENWTTSHRETVTICEQCDPDLCNCGVKLNTPIPFIGSCIMLGDHAANSSSWGTTVTTTTAFPVLMGAIMRILIGVILVVGFGMIVAWGFMMTVPGQYDKGKKLVLRVVYAIIGLGLLGAILYLINPNFFV